ncbi:hypothetical protein LXT12_05680 [Pelomonas sp. P7]|uniref:Phage tail sheath protein n=1 Tax=Pelomonas caseinilytica TaxID=2906763 RepID=A0ABS8XBZ8_9BURK|nr:hypothetical protein [Pelomonas sp. P7]MCE4536740.1 hypothetical protein [Pelomonas sp. P7]
MAVGVRIVDDPSPGGDGLPVMDVPVFVGFAARGPLHRPVALDSAAAYAEVFGGGLDLVQAGGDPAERLVAHLPAAVEAFFAGGGRRCHVIRVAAGTASAARFTVPGLRLASRDSQGHWQLAGADFPLRAASPGDWADRLQLSARLRSQALHAADRVAPGDLLRASQPSRPGVAAWTRVALAGSLVQALASEWLWPQGGAVPIDAEAWLIERVQVDLALRAPGQPVQRLDACGLAPGADKLPWWAPDADGLYDAGAEPAGWPLAGMGGAPAGDWLLLPLAMADDFADWTPAATDGRDALARNGLDSFGPALFVDPAWTPGLRGSRLMAWADELRFFGDAPRRLRGLHGALGRDDACAAEASWVLVPDAVHPGWARTAPLPGRDIVVTTTPDPVCTCPPTTFDDCAPPPPQPPQPPRIGFDPGVPGLPAVLPADRDVSLRLRADPTDGGGAQLLEVQLAGQPDFSDLRVVANLVPAAEVTLRLSAGAWWLRARARRNGLSSGWSTTAELDVRASGWRALAGAAAVDAATPINAALLALCAASREHFALLSVPLDWPAPAIAGHVAALRDEAGRVDSAEAGSAASFAAIHHPWLLQRDADDRLRRHPAAGALMGLLARRSRLHGAWGAPGAEPLATALQLAGELQDAATLEALGANPLALRTDANGTGIAAVRSQTLSQDADWTALGVRRLFILLRRLCRREGQRFVFEPNDLALRRGLERSFDALLHRLMQRGAFRGADAASSYLLKTAAGADAAREMERGECSLLIQVAPSRPLRFLTLHLRRSGEQLVIEER